MRMCDATGRLTPAAGSGDGDGVQVGGTYADESLKGMGRPGAQMPREAHEGSVMGDTDKSAIECAQIQYRLDSMAHENALHAKRCLSIVLAYAVGRGLLAANPMCGHKFDIPAKVDEQSGYDEDPFAAIKADSDVWDIATILDAHYWMRGLPLEPAWLACVARDSGSRKPSHSARWTCAAWRSRAWR